MLRVNGLYGHVRRNNLKSVVLITAFLGLFAVMQTAVQATLQVVPTLLLGPGGAEQLNGVFAAGPNADRILKQVKQRQAELASGQRKPSAVEAVAGAHQRLMRFAREHALILTVAFVAIYLVVATWWNSLYIRFAMRARPLQRREQPELYNLVENLAISAGMPCPAIEVIQSDSLNAYASGLTPTAARIGVTTGLVRTLSRDELEAVIAHELTHIRTRDSRLMAITKACTDLVVSGILKFVRKLRERPFPTLLTFAVLPFAGWTVALIVLAVWCLAGLVTLLAFLAKGAILHAREFVADAGAIELTKNPAALISALRKVSGTDDVGVTNPAARAMMFSGNAEGLLSTHPTIESRIAAIRLIGGSTAADEAAHRARRQRSVAPNVTAAPSLAGGRAEFAGPDRLAPAQGFGRRRVQSPQSAMATGRFPSPDEVRFATQASARTIWREEGVFSARHQAEDGVLGGSLFERWVMSGRLDRVRKGMEQTGTRAFSSMGKIMLGFYLCVMAWGLLMTILMR
jgi:heat shock protein HtpX